MKVLVTGASGLIGGECVEYFGTRGHQIVGVDNNARRQFFGEQGDTLWNLGRVAHKVANYKHHDSSVCDGPVWMDTGRPNQDPDYKKLDAQSMYVFKDGPFDAVIHCAAQPSHDFASQNPDLDYLVNVKGTHNVLDATRRYSPNALFVALSTNKIYDTAVNATHFWELETRYDLLDRYTSGNEWQGFDESTPAGAANVFGQHRIEAETLVQDYHQRYGLRTVILRGGCLTGPGHSGVELHGFLSYLVKCAISGTTYRIFGYKGKQVRDNIHSYDVCRAIEEIIQAPRPGEVYNIGGGRENSVSILEAIGKLESLTGLKVKTEYIEQPRSGDHCVYITDLAKLKAHYPGWSITKSVDQILTDMLKTYLWGDSSEDKETRAYELGPGSVVVDVGGYCGAFTDDIINNFDSFVHLFEPIPEYAAACRHRFKDEPKVNVIGAGLADRDKIVTVTRQGHSTSAFRGGEGQTPMPVSADKPTSEIVSMLDASMLAQFDHIDLLSLNCEGGEFEILPRLIETGIIRNIDNVQIQFHQFAPDAERRRDEIRAKLALTHCERWCTPWLWESWTRTRER